MSDNNSFDLQSKEVLTEDEKQNPKLSFFSRILSIFTNPKKAMEDIAARPTVLVPILLSLVIFALLNVARSDLFKELIIAQLEIHMAQNPNTAELSEAALMTSVHSGLIIVSISPLIIIFCKGLVSHGITQLFIGEGKLKASISVIAFSYFIITFGEVIRSIIGILTKNYMVTTSVVSAFPNLAMDTPLYTLLGSLDVFSIWYLIVSTVGISIIHKISKGKAAVAVFAPWALFIGFNVVMAIMNS